VKSLREGRANLGDSFATVHRGELWLEKLHISPYEAATRANPSDPQRRRKLLLHRSEIDRLDGRVAEKGLTLIPLSVYFLRGRAKVELALARGKHRHDKRQTIRQREHDRETQRAMRRHTR
jgi:SsrA-binding protein